MFFPLPDCIRHAIGYQKKANAFAITTMCFLSQKSHTTSGGGVWKFVCVEKRGYTTRYCLIDYLLKTFKHYHKIYLTALRSLVNVVFQPLHGKKILTKIALRIPMLLEREQTVL